MGKYSGARGDAAGGMAGMVQPGGQWIGEHSVGGRLCEWPALQYEFSRVRTLQGHGTVTGTSTWVAGLLPQLALVVQRAAKPQRRLHHLHSLLQERCPARRPRLRSGKRDGARGSHARSAIYFRFIRKCKAAWRRDVACWARAMNDGAYEERR
jgi:hypothetical protein